MGRMEPLYGLYRRGEASRNLWRPLLTIILWKVLEHEGEVHTLIEDDGDVHTCVEGCGRLWNVGE